MNTDSQEPPSQDPDQTTSASRLFAPIKKLFGAPAKLTSSDFVQALRNANSSNVVDDDSMATIERVVQVAELRARDVMIPRGQMVFIDKDDVLDEILPVVIESKHSRFPVLDLENDRAIGILLAKDLIQVLADNKDDFVLRDYLRPVSFVPESKRLNVLLKEFQESRNHMAVVVDEYGNTAGLVTIEDVIEQIVGEIEDEHDFDEEDSLIRQQDDGTYVVKAIIQVEDFNEYFNSNFPDDEFDTLAGLLIGRAERVPDPGEVIELDGGYRFEILNADGRQIHLVNLTLVPDPQSDDKP